jgi:hypothetical protein
MAIEHIENREQGLPIRAKLNAVIDAINAGASSTGINYQYEFDSTVSAGDPGSGNLRYNNANPTSVTALYVSKSMTNGGSLESLFRKIIAEDVIYIRQSDDPTKYLFATISSVTEHTAYFAIAVTVESGGVVPDDESSVQLLLTKAALVALGETSNTAYRGDRGKIAYDHSLEDHEDDPHGLETYVDNAIEIKADVDAGNLSASYITDWKTTLGVIDLGDSSSEAYRGDRGTIAYDHSQEDVDDDPHGLKTYIDDTLYSIHLISTESELEDILSDVNVKQNVLIVVAETFDWGGTFVVRSKNIRIEGAPLNFTSTLQFNNNVTTDCNITILNKIVFNDFGTKFINAWGTANYSIYCRHLHNASIGGVTVNPQSITSGTYEFSYSILDSINFTGSITPTVNDDEYMAKNFVYVCEERVDVSNYAYNDNAFLVGCKETGRIYMYMEDCTYTIEAHNVLSTRYGGDTRWVSLHYEDLLEKVDLDAGNLTTDNKQDWRESLNCLKESFKTEIDMGDANGTTYTVVPAKTGYYWLMTNIRFIRTKIYPGDSISIAGVSRTTIGTTSGIANLLFCTNQNMTGFSPDNSVSIPFNVLMGMASWDLSDDYEDDYYDTPVTSPHAIAPYNVSSSGIEFSIDDNMPNNDIVVICEGYYVRNT